MTETPAATAPVVVTGANGLVGSRVCTALVERGVPVRAVVRRPGTAPAISGVEERVGDFSDASVAAEVTAGASAVVTTVHPMGSDLETQRRVGVSGTTTLARAAADAGVPRLVHVSTAAVYDRSPDAGDIDEAAALVGDGGGDYAVTKREADAALAEVDDLTVVLVRPPAILGAGESSVWNSIRPAMVRDHESERSANPMQTFAWVHVDDLAAFLADVAACRIASADTPDRGPVAGSCTPVNLAAEPAPTRSYHEAVTGALGVEPVWDEGPAWTGGIVTDRARGWGWTPMVRLEEALEEVAAGLRG